MTEPRIASLMLESDPTVCVTRVTLELTLYIKDMTAWERGGAERACRSFLDVCPPESMRWFTTSKLDEWHRIGEETVLELLPNLTWSGARPRHCFGFWLADEPGAGNCRVAYRSIDTEREGRAGYFQVAIPQDTDPGLLWQLALTLGHEHGFYCGTGGYAAAWNTLHPQTAFHEIRAWCRRYFGLDAQEPERMSWHAVKALPGINWLTLIGASMLEDLGSDASRISAPWQEPGVLTLELGSGGALIRAGERPTLADMHRLTYPRAYAEVARRLDPWVVANPTSHTGGFFVHEDTAPWMRRFVEPEGWR